MPEPDVLSQLQDAALEAKSQLIGQREYVMATTINRPAWVKDNKKLPLPERQAGHRTFLANPGLMDQEWRMTQGRFDIADYDPKGPPDQKVIPLRLLLYGKQMTKDLRTGGSSNAT